MHVLKDLKDIRKLLSKPEHWIKKVQAVDKNASWIVVPATAKNACAWCLTGAIFKVTSENHKDKTDACTHVLEIKKLIIKEIDWDIINFNDHPLTSHDDILKVLDKVIEKAS